MQFERGQVLRLLNQLEVPVKNVGRISGMEVDASTIRKDPEASAGPASRTATLGLGF
jgi:hypothetical protein